jgi:hypothetical protein
MKTNAGITKYKKKYSQKSSPFPPLSGEIEGAKYSQKSSPFPPLSGEIEGAKYSQKSSPFPHPSGEIEGPNTRKNLLHFLTLRGR